MDKRLVNHPLAGAFAGAFARRVLIVLLVILVLSCSLFSGGDDADESAKDTEIALGIQQTLAAQASAAAPVERASPTVPAASPTPEGAAPESSPTPTVESPRLIDSSASQPGDVYYDESFERMEGWWVFPAHGDVDGYGYELFDDRLRAEIVSQDTWVYYMFEGGGDFDDIRLDITVENRASNTNYVGMICRYSDQGWYEANILNTGEYVVYYGDSEGLIDVMHKGASTLIRTGLSVNEYAMICHGEALTLLINGHEVVSLPLKTGAFRFLDQGQVGLSVSTSYAIPVMVDFLRIVLSVP